jgi:acyl carrier protein
MEYKDAVSIVAQAIRKVPQWPLQRTPTETTPIFGPKSDLDSLDVVSVLIEIESAVRDEYEVEISLTMGAEGDPATRYATIGSIAQYLIEVVK